MSNAYTAHGDPTERPRDEVTGRVVWSGGGSIPALGAEVNVRMNGLGAGKVVGYRVVDGWLAVEVKIYDPPSWWIRNHDGDPDPVGVIFGLELDGGKAAG